jgi:hypothetical protein
LQRIREAGVLLAAYRRAIDPAVQEFVDRVLSAKSLRRTAADLEGLLDGFLKEPGGDAFGEDLCWQVDLFRQITGGERLRLKLESFAGSLCERFHIDRVQLRLICSYAGPGTEWLEDRDVDRAKLGPGSGGLSDEESGLLREGARVRRLDRFTVGLMKGGLWPGSRGLVHRSPRVGDASLRRVLFKIDVADE